MITVSDKLMRLDQKVHALVIHLNETHGVAPFNSKKIARMNETTRINYNYNYNRVFQDEFFDILPP